MRVYYNENNKGAADWLESLMLRGLIPNGFIDRRSIVDVQPEDLEPFEQCHFFAGIGGWALAFQMAGIPTHLPVWSGSCPCQGFSVAGKQKGFDDERHLFPAWQRLIEARRPVIIFGEQVASAAVLGKSSEKPVPPPDPETDPAWLDFVFDQLEAATYACGAGDIPAESVGAPHIRQRCVFGAVNLDALGSGLVSQIADTLPSADDRIGHADEGASRWHSEGLCETEEGAEGQGCQTGGFTDSLGPSGATDGLVNAIESGLEGHSGDEVDGEESRRVSAPAAGSTAEADGGLRLADGQRELPQGGLHGSCQDSSTEGGGPSGQPSGHCSTPRLADADYSRLERGVRGGQARVSRQSGRYSAQRSTHEWLAHCHQNGWGQARAAQRTEELHGIVGDVVDAEGEPVSSPLGGFWADADWLLGTDGKYRPVEPGISPMADGVSGRVVLLSGYGNAVVPQKCALFIEEFVLSLTRGMR